MFYCICNFNHKPFSIAVSASSSGNDIDDELGKSFLNRSMLPTKKTLPKKIIVHTKSTKTNKRNNNSKLINAITVTKQKHAVHNRVRRSLEHGLTYRTAI